MRWGASGSNGDYENNESETDAQHSETQPQTTLGRALLILLGARRASDDNRERHESDIEMCAQMGSRTVAPPRRGYFGTVMSCFALFDEYFLKDLGSDQARDARSSGWATGILFPFCCVWHWRLR